MSRLKKKKKISDLKKKVAIYNGCWRINTCIKPMFASVHTSITVSVLFPGTY